MKLRIVKNGLGEYLVQKRIEKGWFSEQWRNLDCSSREYPPVGEKNYGDGYYGVFESLTNAQDKMRKFLSEHNNKKLREKLEVVEVSE